MADFTNKNFSALKYFLCYKLTVLQQHQMNVVRDLRNTITHLQAQLEQKQKQFIRQQQQYQQIITSLQNDNEKLKMLLQGDSMTHKDDDFLRYEDNHQDSSISKSRRDMLDRKQNMGYMSNNEYMELVNQNIYLKNQLSELSMTYQKQIDQLTFYFEKIKQENKKISPAHFAGQMSLINNWVKSFMKDYEAEKQKYGRKLMEYASTLQLYENKIIEQEELIEKMKLELKQNEEKIKIVTRVIF